MGMRRLTLSNSIERHMKILQLFFRPSEKSPQRPPPNEDRSSMADLVRLLEAHAPKKEQR
jgi:hypothetical protein